MRILFCHQNFPGRFGFMAGSLAADPNNEVLFASCHQRRGATVPGVRRVILRTERLRRPPREENYAQIWCRFLLSGKSGYTFLERLNAEFQPECVFSSASGGVTFFAQKAFPRAFHVFYAGVEEALWPGADFTEGSRAALAMQWVQMLQSQLCFIFSERQRELFPPAVRAGLRYLTPWVDTDWMCPDSAEAVPRDGVAPAPELVSFDMRHFRLAAASDLRDLMRDLLTARPDCRIVACFGGNPAFTLFDAWRARLPQPLGHRLRVVDFLRPAEYRDMFRATCLHVCADASPSSLPGWREAMSCGAALMMPAADAFSDALLKPGETMLTLPRGSRQDRLTAVLHPLERPEMRAAVGRAARGAVVAARSPQTLVPPHLATVLEAYERYKSDPQ